MNGPLPPKDVAPAPQDKPVVSLLANTVGSPKFFGDSLFDTLVDDTQRQPPGGTSLTTQLPIRKLEEPKPASKPSLKNNEAIQLGDSLFGSIQVNRE